MAQKIPLSIVIPAKDEEIMLPRLLRSINSQLFQPQEVIVAVSPATTDRTAEVAKELGATVVDGGIIAIGRNNGAKIVKGEIILFLDADSALPSDVTLGELYVNFKKHRLDIASTYLELDKEESKNFLQSIFPNITFNIWNSLKRLSGPAKRVLIESGTGIMVRKEVFDSLGGFKSDLEIIGEDFEFTKRAVDNGYTYKVLPLKLITSGRRYEDPKKGLQAAAGALIFAGIIGLGLYNRKNIVNFARRLYGEMGGTKK